MLHAWPSYNCVQLKCTPVSVVYTYTVEPKASLASVEVWRQSKKLGQKTLTEHPRLDTHCQMLGCRATKNITKGFSLSFYWLKSQL